MSFFDKIDWISYWKLIGNPFLDQPLSYGSKYYVETKKLKKISNEIESILKANQGDIRLLLGERGLGKTTLLLTPKVDESIRRATNNIPRLDLQTATDVNVVDLLHHQYVITTKDGIKELENRLVK